MTYARDTHEGPSACLQWAKASGVGSSQGNFTAENRAEKESTGHALPCTFTNGNIQIICAQFFGLDNMPGEKPANDRIRNERVLLNHHLLKMQIYGLNNSKLAALVFLAVACVEYLSIVFGDGIRDARKRSGTPDDSGVRRGDTPKRQLENKCEGRTPISGRERLTSALFPPAHLATGWMLNISLTRQP